MSETIKLVWLQVRDQGPPGLGGYDLLDRSELERAHRFKVSQPRRVFVAARAALRKTLAAELGLDPRSLTFSMGSHGKPHLDLATDLEFNLAHSGSTIAIALTRGTALGVDIEELGHQVPALRLARRFFSADEAAAVENAPPESRLEVFYHFWTAKEAVLKATGSGLAVPVREIEIAPDPDEPLRVLKAPGDPPGAAPWRLLRHRNPGKWIITVAHQGDPRELDASEFTDF